MRPERMVKLAVKNLSQYKLRAGLTMLGIIFGVLIGKEIFGGTGKNFLNPALTARAFLYFAYSNQIVGDTVWTAADGFSGATPLGAAAIAPTTEGGALKAMQAIEQKLAAHPPPVAAGQPLLRGGPAAARHAARRARRVGPRARPPRPHRRRLRHPRGR